MLPRAPAASAAKFPTTQWSAILSLQEGDDCRARQQAMQRLCQNYWFPLYAFARHRGLLRQDAEDAVQSFFLSIGEVDFFQKADQNRGKFRTFVLTAFHRQLTSQHRYEVAQKRGGGALHLSIDADQAEIWLLADPKTLDQDATKVFERHWAKNIIRTVLETLQNEANLNPKTAERFEILSRFLSPEGCIDYSLKQAATDLQIAYGTCEKAVQRLRQQFRQAVREEVASTLNNPDDASVTEEMMQLQKSLLSEAE
jgi:DNA-directed RNA polymerase specialized sigma24 family protein